LGSYETDVITQLTRKQSSAGLFGSKLAGGWADGLMAVLMRDDRAAWMALDQVAAEAAQQFNRPFRVLNGNDAGAAVRNLRDSDAAAGTPRD
jgi:hypothetical protein